MICNLTAKLIEKRGYAHSLKLEFESQWDIYSKFERQDVWEKEAEILIGIQIKVI